MDGGVKMGRAVAREAGSGRNVRVNPLLLKTGIALALSFAGYLFSQFRSHRSAASRCLRLPPPEVDLADVLNSGRREGGADSVEELHQDKVPGEFPAEPNSTSVIISPSTTSGSSGDDVGYLLPEFNDLVQEEFEFTAYDTDYAAAPISPKNIGSEEAASMELEITNLKDRVHSLQERETNLELQLLEYYGHKEQQATVQELQNRLRVYSVEAKLYNIKIASLEADNQRFKEQVSDNTRLVAEVESARERIDYLEKKLKSEADHAKDELAALGQRVAALQECERAEQKLEEEFQQNLIRVNELEGEVRDLKEGNSRLVQENAELVMKLESSEGLVSNALKNSQGPIANETLEEVNRLRLRNEELTKEIEHIQIDRCSDLEELIHLRWINACLRYKLRNYEPLEGKSVARDLSMTLSPKSEEKAKQLILEYAHSGNSTDKFPFDFGLECCSSSHSSSITETEEIDDGFNTTKNSNHSGKFFSKIKKLVLGKGTHNKKLSSSDTADNFYTSEGRASIPQTFLDGVTARSSCDSLSSCISLDHAPEHKSLWDDNLHRASAFDGLKPIHSSHDESQIGKHGRCISDLGESHGYRRFILGERNSGGSSCGGQTTFESVESEEEELRKFADALKSTRRSMLNHKRSKSHGIH